MQSTKKDLKNKPDSYSAATRRRILPNAFFGAADYVNATRKRTQLIDAFHDAMTGLDAAITVSSHETPANLSDMQGLSGLMADKRARRLT